jgi:type IV pilus assembly protein PilM
MSMWQWVHRRPHCCLKIGPLDVAWAEVHRDWRGRAQYRSAVAALPDGVVRVSPLEANVLKPQDLQDRIRGIAAPVKPRKLGLRDRLGELPRAVTLMVPDITVRLTLLHLQDLPVRHEEREALIRWRLGQDQLLSPAGARICFQVLPAAERLTGARNTVLAVVAQEAVLEQYESVCEAVGLLPEPVEVSSLALFNLWMRSLGGIQRLVADFLWVNVSDGGFTALVFHKGHLVFLRTKLQGGGGVRPAGATEQEPPWMDTVIAECAASVYACQQHHPALAVTNVVITGLEDAQRGLSEKLAKELGVTVKELGWDDLCRDAGKPGCIESPSMLPAMAGIL